VRRFVTSPRPAGLILVSVFSIYQNAQFLLLLPLSMALNNSACLYKFR
jgi:hypothetical protein